MSIKEKILMTIKEEGYRPIKKEDMAKKFEITGEWKREFFKMLEEMKEDGLLHEDKKSRIESIESAGYVVGKIQMNQRGYGFVISDNKEIDEKDVFISPGNLNTAMNGDRVIAEIEGIGNRGKNPEGSIVRVIERKNTKIIGIYQKSRSFGFVVPSNKNVNDDIFIPKQQSMKAENNQIVEVEITRWGGEGKSPEGKVTEVLGYKDEDGIDILTIIKSHDLPLEFSRSVIEETQDIEENISKEEIKRRKDLRGEITFTIDGADAKDFDDAVSIKKLENGNYLLGVHIADVTHYVKENSELDKEALSRGTSVYLVDRVIPMLPEKLSNGVCSLNPHRDRLTLSVLMEMDNRGKVVNHEIVESVIRSDERLIYEDISDIIENNDLEQMKKYNHIMTEITLMNELCGLLMKKRESRGSIEFEFSETKIVLDSHGKTVDIVEYDRRIANRIIEEFMLVTNETVAEYMYWTQVPFIYRTHDKPDEEKMLQFVKFVHNLGYKMKGYQNIHPKNLQELLLDTRGKKEESLINSIMLRALKRAVYTSEVGEHFGLATEYYTHFTSPIRRYPDLQIHRIIKLFINNMITPRIEKKLKAKLPKVAEQSSNLERRADEAERDTDDLKKVEFMKDKIGKEYDGIISGMMGSGLFVALENTIEGFIHIKYLRDDYYNYDDKTYSLLGERTGKRYTIGDKVKVKVTRADIEARQIDFELLG